MGILRASSAVSLLALAACGSDHAKVDAAVVIPDAVPDAKVWQDAPPGPTYDLSCFGGSAPTTASDPITISGTTGTLSQGTNLQGIAGIDVEVFKSTSPTAVASVTSGAMGAFVTGNIATNNEPLDGYVKATDPGNAQNNTPPAHRTTYLYPPTVVAANLTGVPVPMISNQTFGLIQTVAGDQDDDLNGALLVLVTDCSGGLTLIDGATVTVKQNGADVGSLIDLGALIPQAAGTYFALNVPDGETDVAVSYSGKDFPVRTVLAHKKPAGAGAQGTMTVVPVRPGP